MNHVLRPLAAAAALVLLALVATPASAQYAHDPATGHYYLRTPYAANFATARTLAANAGGHLATIADAGEQALLTAAFASSLTTAGLWIGLSDATTEGVWVWDDGTPYSYANWYPGEPNNASNEDAVAILPVSGGYQWNDFPTTGTAFGIVEVDAPVAGDVPATATTVVGSTTWAAYSSIPNKVPGLVTGLAAPCTMWGSPSPPDCWFRYDATASGTLTVSNCPASTAAPGGSGFSTSTDDIVLAAYGAASGAPGVSLTCSGSSPQCGSVEAEIAFPVQAGQSYFVQVLPYNNVSPVLGTLAFKLALGNDDCATAEPLALGVNGPFDNTAATDAPVFLNCETAGRDMWFSYTVSEAAEVSITTATPPGAAAGTLNDPNLQVFAVCGGAPIACVDDVPGAPLTATFSLTAGQTAYVRVAGWNGQWGTFHLTVAETRHALRLSSPAGPGSLLVEHVSGTPFATYLAVFTLNAGGYPDGWYYGIDPTPTEFLLQAVSFAPPFFGALDTTGRATFGPLLGAPPITLYASAAYFAPTGAFATASPPVAYTIP